MLYQCPECGLHYEDEATAKRCEAWCSEHKSCNLKITMTSIENQKIAEERRKQDGSQPPSAPRNEQ